MMRCTFAAINALESSVSMPRLLRIAVLKTADKVQDHPMLHSRTG